MSMGTSHSVRRSNRGQNAEFPWDTFDSRSYFAANYSKIRHDDQKIVEVVRDFFSVSGVRAAEGIDVGSGPNLYPALAMLPLCETVTLYEYSDSNIEWLHGQKEHYSRPWDAFWDVLAGDPLYEAVPDPRDELRRRARIVQGSVFELPEARWNIGTMFFVAESLSSDKDEFRAALDSFLRCLKPGAPFAAAFMENSTGYAVGDTAFPAVAIETKDVAQCLGSAASSIHIDRIAMDDKPLREGYSGMILAWGRIMERGKD